MYLFSYRKVEKLPRLAWCARLSARSGDIIVDHGPWVETRKDCFFAAAWSGPLDEAKPDEAVVCIGTGARLESGLCTFFASSNLSDRLYLKRASDGLVISNSLAYLMVATDDEPASRYFMYYEMFLMFAGQGIDREQRSVPTRCGQVEVYECCNLKFGRDLHTERCDKPVPPPPSDYHQYISLLETHLELVLNNASDATRIVRYSPFANVSRGYDSSFVAALARRYGVFEAITFTEETPGVPVPDDGSPIAEILGMNVHKFAKRGYPSSQSFPEAEFLACPPGWESPWGAAESVLAGSVNLSGHYGGHLLEVSKELLPGLGMHSPIDTGSMDSWEYRLRIGCLEFPLLFTGWQHGPTVRQIATSTAMRRWSIGGDYNRPIPRRALEEAGVPRELFGQVKYAGAAEFFESRDHFRSATWEDIENFIEHFTNTYHPPVMAPERFLFHWAFYRIRERFDDAGI